MKEGAHGGRRSPGRTRQPDNDGWLVIADATGVARGAKGSKLQTLTTYVNQFLIEEGNAIVPRQWLLVNRLADRVLTDRGDSIFRPDVLAPFAAAWFGD